MDISLSKHLSKIFFLNILTLTLDEEISVMSFMLINVLEIAV